MTIIWGGTLAVLLSRFRKKLFRVTRLNHDIDAQIKRTPDGIAHFTFNA